MGLKTPRAEKQSGIALLLVLSVLAFVIILAKTFLILIENQSELTHHRVSRIQAYYAGRLGMQYAMEMIGKNPNWPGTASNTFTICRSGCNKLEPDLPLSINNITIFVGAPNSGIQGTRAINITVDYTAPD